MQDRTRASRSSKPCHLGLVAAILSGNLLATPSAHALSVITKVEGTLITDSNFNTPADTVSELEFIGDVPVPGSLPPIAGAVRGRAKADGETGALRAQVEISSPNRVNAGRTLEMSAFMSESFRVRTTAGSSGIRRPGVVGLGTANDGVITIRASGVLTGFGAVGGGASGVPGGISPGSAGSTRATMSFGLNVGGLNSTLTFNETTGILGPVVTVTDNEASSINGSSVIEFNGTSGTITLNLDSDRYFSLTNQNIVFEAALRAFARVGNFDSAQVFASYGNSSYFNIEVEDGFFWEPGNNVNRSFLANPEFPGPAPVPVPAALPLFAVALGALARCRRR